MDHLSLQAVLDCAALYRNITSRSDRYREYISRVEAAVTGRTKDYSDHGLQHVYRVTEYGEAFLQLCRTIPWGDGQFYTTEKDLWLFRIATALHDIGLAADHDNHAKASAKLAKEFLDPDLISEADAHLILHAIKQHSSGKKLTSPIDAALFLGDKLDMTFVRVKSGVNKSQLSPMQQQMLLIEKVDFTISNLDFYQASTSEYPYRTATAELHYQTSPGTFITNRLGEWPKCITGPLHVAKDYLGLSSFKFFVNGQVVDYTAFIAPSG